MSVDPIETQAAEWVVCEDRGLGLRERVAFDHWIAQDLAHRVTFLRLKAAWRRADRLSTVKAGMALPRRAGPLTRHSGKLMAGAALAACLALVAGLGLAKFAHPGDQLVVTAAGQHRSLTLTDGTKIQLGGDTALRASDSGPGRAVTLDHGMAYFDVVHDARHPFTVYAGNRKITDLGTKFSVSRNGDKVEVVVTEGRVRIDVLDAAIAAPVIADVENMVIAKDDGTLVKAPQKAENPVRANWRAELLIFHNEALGDVAQEFNRYNRKQIHVAANARDVKIGGSFRADNVDGFKALLEQGFDVKVKEDREDIYITR